MTFLNQLRRFLRSLTLIVSLVLRSRHHMPSTISAFVRVNICTLLLLMSHLFWSWCNIQSHTSQWGGLSCGKFLISVLWIFASQGTSKNFTISTKPCWLAWSKWSTFLLMPLWAPLSLEKKLSRYLEPSTFRSGSLTSNEPPIWRANFTWKAMGRGWVLMHLYLYRKPLLYPYCTERDFWALVNQLGPLDVLFGNDVFSGCSLNKSIRTLCRKSFQVLGRLHARPYISFCVSQQEDGPHVLHQWSTCSLRIYTVYVSCPRFLKIIIQVSENRSSLSFQASFALSKNPSRILALPCLQLRQRLWWWLLGYAYGVRRRFFASRAATCDFNCMRSVILVESGETCAKE